MDKLAIFAYVAETTLSKYSNDATLGVGNIAQSLINELRPAFGDDVVDVGPRSTVQQVASQLEFAAKYLSKHGLCFFYFHGHGDSIRGVGRQDEFKDQALVCHDGYLVDDQIDDLLRKFKPTQRILSVVDCCSSETVIEWSSSKISNYPQIIHIASAHDGQDAGAAAFGGMFSQRMLSLI